MSVQDFYQWAERHTNLATTNTIAPSRQKDAIPPPEYQLDTMKRLVELCDNPHRSYNIVHIAGSKGKGTTARIVAEMLVSMGYSVGCYLSPHIHSYDERFMVLPKSATEQVKQDTAVGLYRLIHQYNHTHNNHTNTVQKVSPPLQTHWRNLQALMDNQPQSRSLNPQQHRSSSRHKHDTFRTRQCNASIPPSVIQNNPVVPLTDGEPFTNLVDATTFELLTLYAFLLFKACNCQWVVLECGLGGRLDATNVVTPTITAITSIEKEHTAYLGNTYRKIAIEKGGIIKHEVPIVLNPLRPSAKSILLTIARRMQAPVILTKRTLHHQSLRKIAVDRQLVVKLSEGAIHIPIDYVLPWSIINMRMALAIMRTLFPQYDVSKWRAALHVQLRGRYTTVHCQPPIIVDGAHTPVSLSRVVKTFVNSYGRNTTVLFGCFQDKQISKLIRILARNFSHYYFVNGSSPRFCTSATLRTIALKKIKEGAVTIAHLPLNDAVVGAMQLNLPVLVCGSFYLVGEVMQYLATSD